MRFYFLISIFGVCQAADKAGARMGWNLWSCTNVMIRVRRTPNSRSSQRTVRLSGGLTVRTPSVWSSGDPGHDHSMIRSPSIVPTRIYTNFCLNEASLEEMPIFLLGFGIEWLEEVECGWVPEWTMHFLQWPNVVRNLDSGTWHTISKLRFISIMFELFSIMYCIISCKIIRKKKEFEAI